MSRVAKIGLFVLVSGVAGVVFIVMSGDGFSDRNTYEVEIVMDDASGLTTNSQIFMAGVPIGTIRSIELQDGRARLSVMVSDEIAIYEDATAYKEASSLLGTSIISIDPGSSGAASLDAGGRIEQVSVRGDFARTVDITGEIGQEMVEMLAEIRRQHMVVLNRTFESFDRILERVDLRSEDDLQQVSEILASVALTVERIALMVDDRDADIQDSIASLRRSLDDVQDVTATVRRGEGNIGRAVYEDELYERVVSVARSTEELVHQITGLGVQVGFESAYMSEREQAQSAFSLRLLPRSRRGYYELGVVDTPGGVTRSRTTEEVETVDGGAATTTVSEETVTTDEVKFNAQIARSFGPLTLRGGLIESSGGFGVDLRPFPAFQVSGEVFDFGADDEPNLRATGTIFPFYDPAAELPWYWVYLTGGMNNILSEQGRELFFGGGVRFTDEDIRGLVGLIPFGG
ncbi:MAG: MCE family protein [Spirochaetaceae bacterium]|nr:MAG: MCE family protein [Spirochaetaceae bacterium]